MVTPCLHHTTTLVTNSLPSRPPHRNSLLAKNASVVHWKLSSSFLGFRGGSTEELSNCAKVAAAKEAHRCAVSASLANVDSPCVVKVAENLAQDFARRDEDGDRKADEPILYDNLCPPTNVYAPGRRIVALGDLHGDLARTESALRLAGILSSDGQGRWIGGNTVFVQVGDILDRGEDEIAILSLLHNLGQQAHRRGGAVFQINGNHETMNVEGDFRFVEPGGFEEAEKFTLYCEEEHGGDYDAAFSGWYLASKKSKDMISRPSIVSWILTQLQKQRRAAARALLFNPGGPIALKLAQHGVVLKVNGWLFAHGGILPHHVEYGLERLNKEVTLWMRGERLHMGGQEVHLPFIAIRGFNSIVWSRLYSRDDNNRPQENACAALEATLRAAGANALVVGHTPQIYGANCECEGQVWRIDVGMSSGVLNAEPEVLEIIGSEARVLRCETVEEENRSFTDVQH